MNDQLLQEGFSVGVEQISDHASLPSYQCSHCQRQFSRLDHLSRHVRTRKVALLQSTGPAADTALDTREKPFSCGVCGKAFSRNDLLKRHGCRHASQRRLDPPKPLGFTTRVSQACKACAASKVKCDDTKPCGRCLKKNLTCIFEWNASDEAAQPQVENVELRRHCGRQENVPQTQLQSPGQPQIEPAVEMNFELNTPTATEHSNDLEMLSRQGASTLSIGPENDASHMHGIPIDFDLADLQTYGFETGFTEATLTYADFLKDLLNWDGPSDDVVPRPGVADGQEKSNIWDQHLNMDQSFDALFDFPIPDFTSPMAQNEHPTSTLDVDNSAKRRKLANRTSFEETAFAAGAQAFKRSWLNWNPDPMHQPCLEQDEDSLSVAHDWAKDSLPRDPSLSHQPLSMADRDRVLWALLSFSSKRRLIHIASTFPGVHEMESMLHGFLRHQLGDTFPWFHVPTFRLSGLRDELLATLIAFGASLTHVEVAQKLGHAMADILRSAVIEKVSAHFARSYFSQQKTTDPLPSGIKTTVCLAICSCCKRYVSLINIITFLGIYSGDRCKMEIAESTSQPLITILRRAHWLEFGHYEPILPNHEDDDATNQRKWEAWVEQESRKRLIYQVYILDTNISIMHLTTSVMHFDEMQLPVPEPDDLWFAPTASEWRSRYLSRPRLTVQPTLCENMLRLLTDRDMVPSDDPLTSDIYVLHGLWRVIWEHRRLQDLVILAREHSPETQSASLGGVEKLSKILARMSSRIAGYSENSSSVKISEYNFLLEFLSMTLHVPLYYLQAFAGKDGAKEAQRVCHVLQEWTPTREARQAMWHGGQLIRAAKELPAEKMRDIKVVVVYQTSLAFWAYGTIHVARRKRDGRTTPTLPNVSHLMGKSVVPLNGPLTSAVRKFISLDEGLPYISDTDWQKDENVEQGKVKLLLQPSEMVGVAIRVLRPYRQGCNKSYPPLVESFTRLMSEIGKAAQVIGM
ncbi:hypothetical protein F1880_002076 [Penicillium rolfsii]|nr:hypothetical protein F1880_002076 [Penicillium rolfsii]